MKNIILKIILTSISIIRAVFNYKSVGMQFSIQNDNQEICVLGNGPSLINSMKNNTNFMKCRHSMCVNDFAESDIFEVIKPRYYVFLDPDYWREESLPELITQRERVFNRIKIKTTWNLTLLLPINAKSAIKWLKIFSSNKYIKIEYFNNTPLTGFEFIIHPLFKYNFGMPPAQNVLVAGIFLAMNMGYKTIYIFGADHSWHEDIVINEDNVLCYKNKHFYDNDDVMLIPWQKGDNSGATWKMHEILMALAKMFEGYQSLELYSRYKNINIYNVSSKTSIDAFKRYIIPEAKE